MNFAEHAVISRKTWNIENTTKEQRLNHAKLGLIDEMGEIASCIKKNVGYGKEIDLVNLKEEIGDFIYFLQRYMEEINSPFNIDFDKCYSYSGSHIHNKLSIDAVLELDLYKAELISYVTDYALKGTVSTIKTLVIKNNLNISDILQTNINKLKARYGEELEFTQDKAVNRNLENERKVLENE